MKIYKKKILWVLWSITVIGLGLLSFYDNSFSGTKYHYIRILIYLGIVVSFPLSEFQKKLKVNKLKRELNFCEDMSLDEIESLRIERDYQENYVKKWKHKHSDK